MQAMTEKIAALANDEEFVNSLLTMDDNAEVQKAFAERGVDLTVEQIDQMAEMAFGKNGELNESDLENVAGGFLAEAAIVCSGIALFCNCMAEYNNSRKAKGKKPIW